MKKREFAQDGSRNHVLEACRRWDTFRHRYDKAKSLEAKKLLAPQVDAAEAEFWRAVTLAAIGNVAVLRALRTGFEAAIREKE